MLVQNNFLEGYRDYAVDAGNSHMRFYDVTSWSYVNLDDPFWDRFCASRKGGTGGGGTGGGGTGGGGWGHRFG